MRSASWRRLLSSPQEVLGLDLRSLALLRIGLGLSLVLDLLYRARFLEAHYSDAGILPRALLREAHPDVALFALHSLSGAVGYQALLFGIALVFAVLLLVGYRTRIAGIASWVLLVSLHFRHPFVVDGGSNELRILLFWSLFLPLGERFSIDARRRQERARRAPLHASAASAALLTQVAVIYFFAGLAKSGPRWWVYGNALRWAVVDPAFAQPLAYVVARFPELLRVLSFGVLTVELVGPLLLFCPLWNGPIRTLVCASLMALQVGIGLTIWVWLFPLTSVAGLAGLLPGWFWERLPERWQGPRAEPRAAAPARAGPLARARDAFLLAALAWVLIVNVASRVERIALPHWFLAPGAPIKLDQNWRMYAAPRRVEIRYDFLGITRDGRRVSLADEGPGEAWQVVRAIQSDYHFRQSQFMLRWRVVSESLKLGYARWLCRQWNADAPPERGLVSLDLIALSRHLRLDGAHHSWRADRVFSHRCEP